MELNRLSGLITLTMIEFHLRQRFTILGNRLSIRILFLGTAIPFPPIGGGNMRTYNLLKALASRPDVRPYYQKAEVVVVPLLSGGGTRLKILEAAASGKAIISTSFGIEGLEFVPGKDLIVADSPADFAKAIIFLCRDEVRRRELEKRARYVSLQYNWESISSEVCHIVENVVMR